MFLGLFYILTFLASRFSKPFLSLARDERVQNAPLVCRSYILICLVNETVPFISRADEKIFPGLLAAAMNFIFLFPEQFILHFLEQGVIMELLSIALAFVTLPITGHKILWINV